MEKLIQLMREDANRNQGHRYWDGKGLFQQKYDLYWSVFVPASGEASTPFGKALRGLGRLAHDFWNNGYCNTYEIINTTCEECDGFGHYTNNDLEQEECDWCGGGGEQEGEAEYNRYYWEMVCNIDNYLGEMHTDSALQDFLRFLHEGGTNRAYCHEWSAVFDVLITKTILKFETSLDQRKINEQ